MADTGTIWSDRFRDWDGVYGRRGVALLRRAGIGAEYAARAGEPGRPELRGAGKG